MKGIALSLLILIVSIGVNSQGNNRGCNRCTAKTTVRNLDRYPRRTIQREQYLPVGGLSRYFSEDYDLEYSSPERHLRLQKRNIYFDGNEDICIECGYLTACFPKTRGLLATGLWIILLGGGILQSFINGSPGTNTNNLQNPGIFPAPGLAPPGEVQPGQPGGGGIPSSNPGAASLTPFGTVPVAVFPPFETPRTYPARCVIFSELEYHEKHHLYEKPSYHGKRKRAIFDAYDRNEISSYGSPLADSTSYDPPSYYPTYNRKYGYVCEYITFEEDCEFSRDCFTFNNATTDSYSERQDNAVFSPQTCRAYRNSCKVQDTNDGFSRGTLYPGGNLLK